MGFDHLPAPARTLEMAMEVAKVAMEVAIEATLAAAPSLEPARPAAAIKPAPVLPLRQVKTGPHPVITRMVVSARRGGVLEPMAVIAASGRETSAVAPSLDGPHSPSPPPSRARGFSRR
jgi:hypothetical protein